MKNKKRGSVIRGILSEFTAMAGTFLSEKSLVSSESQNMVSFGNSNFWIVRNGRKSDETRNLDFPLRICDPLNTNFLMIFEKISVVWLITWYTSWTTPQCHVVPALGLITKISPPILGIEKLRRRTPRNLGEPIWQHPNVCVYASKSMKMKYAGHIARGNVSKWCY